MSDGDPWTTQSMGRKVRHDCSCNDSSPLQLLKHKRKENIPTLSLKLVLLSYLIQKKDITKKANYKVIFIINIDVKSSTKCQQTKFSNLYESPSLHNEKEIFPSVRLVYHKEINQFNTTMLKTRKTHDNLSHC